VASGERLVFIGGLHRSGTSLVHRCLSDHPDVSGFHDTGVPEDEGQHLQSVYLPAWRFGQVGQWGFNRASYLDEHSSLVSKANAERLLSDWLGHWDTSRRTLIEKSPPNLVRTRFLQALFPRCRFVMVLRHPIAVAYASQKWTTRMPFLRSLGVPDRRMPKVWIRRLVEHWIVCHERFERDRDFLTHVHVLRYEDFVARPQQHLDALFSFLGLPSVPLRPSVHTRVNELYWEKWEGRRSNLLTRRYCNRTIRELEDRVRPFGYSLLRT
jgi:hypothetical protein